MSTSGSDEDLGVVDGAQLAAHARGQRASEHLPSLGVMGVVEIEKTDEDVDVEDDYAHPARPLPRAARARRRPGDSRVAHDVGGDGDLVFWDGRRCRIACRSKSRLHRRAVR
jgi:hypothetical protein